MRRILAATLLLSPLFLPAAAVASSPVKDASASTPTRPVSTGVVAPTLVRSTDVIVSPDLVQSIRGDSTVVLEVNLDQQGKTGDIQVVKSLNPILDKDVVEAVRQFRWLPAKLDNQAIPTDLMLNVVVQH